MTRRRAGFTLIELMTVIVVLGVLATIALPNYWHVRHKAKVTAMQSDLRNLATQQEVYHDRMLTYGASVAVLGQVSLSPGVQIDITYADSKGWAAQAAYDSYGDVTCGCFIGDAPPASGSPATSPGVVTCR